MIRYVNHLVMWPSGFRISEICNPTNSFTSYHIPFNRLVWQLGLGFPWKVWPGELHFQVFKVPMKMRLFWLSLVLSLAKRLHPVVEEVARWCFQPDISPFAFLVFCDFLLYFHCNGFWLCHHTIFTFPLLSIFRVWISGIFVFFHHGKYKCRLIPHGQGRSCGQPIFPSPQPPQSATPVEIRVSSLSLLWVEAFEAPQQTRKSLIPTWRWHTSKDMSTSILRVPPQKMLFWRRPWSKSELAHGTCSCHDVVMSIFFNFQPRFMFLSFPLISTTHFSWDHHQSWYLLIPMCRVARTQSRNPMQRRTWSARRWNPWAEGYIPSS